MKKKHIIYTLSTIPLTIAIGNVNESNAFFGLDSFITKNKTVNDIVNIEDDNLLKAINKQLGRGEVMDSITITDMESLTILNAQERNISSIEGLEYAVNLRELNLGSNKLINISQLSNLVNLTKLYLYDNQISDISSLSNLTNLTELYIGYSDKNGNNVRNISSLSNLINLRKLNIEKNKVSDISSLSNLTNLNVLHLSSNQISDISPVRNLINLKDLRLHTNKITDISVFNNLTNLNILYLNDNQISDISAINNLTNLTYLQLANNRISDILFLSNLLKLNELYLDNNQISDISPLRNLTNLDILCLGFGDSKGNNIKYISPIENLVNLKKLYLQNNKIEDISILSNLTNLNTLYLNNNQISDISSLGNLTGLRELHLGGNQILDVSYINNLTNLTYLQLANNQITDISELRNLTNLNTLYLNSNRILDISAINNLTNLTYLQLANNKISDILSLSNLLKLNELYLDNNQISDISSLRNLTNLDILYLGFGSSKGNNVKDISPIGNLVNLKKLNLQNNKIEDISPIKNLKNLTTLNLSNQKTLIEAGDFKSKTSELDISIDNPIIGLNNKVLNITNISNNGFHENGKLKWNNVHLGNHVKTFNFSENVTVGSVTTTFSGTATINFNVVDGGAPESDHTSDFDNSDFGIYTTVTANDLGVGVDYLMHKGVIQSLPYRFKYDILEPSNNIVEVYDLVGNKAEYQVKLKDSDIPTIEEGLDALVNKSDSEKEDISYFRKIINDLDESMNKYLLQDRLNSIYPNTLSLDKKSTTSNMDVYIKCENILQMSLDTNSITFEDFSGVENIVKENAVNISINSSLPYQLNAYLPVEIQNADKTNTMDKQILNIKENSESAYQVFSNTTDKIVLKDNNPAGNDLIHGVDIKLSGGIAHEKDVYKTTIKFEAEQK